MPDNDYPELIRRLPKYEGRFDAFQLQADNCKVMLASYPAGTRIEPHSHDTDNVGVLTKGELLLTINGETRHFKPGQWYHVPAHCEHAAEFPTDTDEIEFWFTPASD